MAILAYRSVLVPSFPIEMFPGTEDEVLTRGQVVILSSGALTSAGVDSDGDQTFIMIESATGDGSTLLAVHRIRDDVQYRTPYASAPTVGNNYTLNTGRVGITATTTKGVFRVDGVNTDDEYAYGVFV